MSAGRRLRAVADALPVTVLAVIAGAGSFTHIRDTAAEHGQAGPMSWAVAVCVDLTCVMGARERQRDKQAGIPVRRLSWPAVVLAGGVLLSLAANLAQAQPTAWGRIVAAVPPGAFLVAVSMIERRAARRPRPADGQDGGAGEPSAPGRPSPLLAAGDEVQDGGDEALLTAAHRAAAEHQDQHGQPITRDALRARLGISNQAASELLRQLRADEGHPRDARAAWPWLPPRIGRRPWSAEGRPAVGAVCARAGVLPGGRAAARGTARQAPRRRGNLPGTGSSATGRPARDQRPLAWSAAGLPAAGAEGRRPSPRRGGRGRSAETGRPFIRVREPVILPHRQLIRTPVGAPPRLVPPGGGECAGRGEIKPSGGLPDSLYAHSS